MTIRSDPDMRPDGTPCPTCGRVMHYQSCTEGICAEWMTEAKQWQRSEWEKYREERYADRYGRVPQHR